MQLALVAAAVVLAGVVFWRRRPDRGLAESLLLALTPVAAGAVLVVAAGAMAEAHVNDWNGIRLAPSVALLHGYGPYVLPGDGPMLAHIYGPVSPVVYLPAALLPTPTLAVRAGVALTFLMCLLPAILIAWTSRVGATVGVAAVVAFALYVATSDPLHFTAFWIHADTPAVVFAALACLPLMEAARRREARWLGVSALAVVLAVGSKQPALPVVVALPAFLWLANGWRVALWYLALVAMWGLAAGVMMVGTIDVPAMLYQAVVVPAEHPWRFNDASRAFVQTLRDFVPRALPAAGLVAVAGAWHLRSAGQGLRSWVGANPWLVPLVVAVCCLPTSILGRMKVGGSMPTLAFTIYPLAVAALAAALQRAGGLARTGRVTRVNVPAVLLVAVLAVLVGLVVPRLPPASATMGALGRDPDAAALAFVRAHPGQVYLPQHPLFSLMADGRADNVVLPTLFRQYLAHVAAGADLEQTTADDEVVRPFVPPAMRYIMVRVHPGTDTSVRLVRPEALLYLRRYFPEYVNLVPVAPGWAAFVAAGP